jgi:hypothetical protein
VRQVFIAPLTLLYVSLSGALGLLESSGTVSGQDVINISTVLPCVRVLLCKCCPRCRVLLKQV